MANITDLSPKALRILVAAYVEFITRERVLSGDPNYTELLNLGYIDPDNEGTWPEFGPVDIIQSGANAIAEELVQSRLVTAREDIREGRQRVAIDGRTMPDVAVAPSVPNLSPTAKIKIPCRFFRLTQDAVESIALQYGEGLQDLQGLKRVPPKNPLVEQVRKRSGYYRRRRN